jgi:hypothetical protein
VDDTKCPRGLEGKLMGLGVNLNVEFRDQDFYGGCCIKCYISQKNFKHNKFS